MVAFDQSKETKTKTVLTYAFSGDGEWNGLRYKTIEHRWLEASIEMDKYHMELIADEADLKALARLPAFKKLLTKPAP